MYKISQKKSTNFGKRDKICENVLKNKVYKISQKQNLQTFEKINTRNKISNHN